MNSTKPYSPGPASLATVDKSTEDWRLILVKELKHSPEKVWDALTDPAQLKEWAPFDSDVNLGKEGANAKLTTVGAPPEHATAETQIKRADPPRLLEYTWGGGDVRWELVATESGTRLTLWAMIDRKYIAMGAAGWHVCLEVLEHNLDGDSAGRHVGPELMKDAGWQRLFKEYGEQFGVEPTKWS